MYATCGNCGKEHETIFEYRDCAVAAVEGGVARKVLDEALGEERTIEPPSDKQVVYALDLQRTHIWPDEFSEEDLKAMERRQVSALIDALYKAPRRENGANSPKSTDEWKDIPDGRYALQFTILPGEGDTIWKFFQVKHGHTRTFVDMLIGSPGAYRHQNLHGVAAGNIFEQIRKVGARQASIDFGIQSETCGVCSSPLTNPDSIEYGIGPKCRNKMGW